MGLKKNGTQKTGSFCIVSDRAQKVGRRSGFKITGARWHIENTAFNQWVALVFTIGKIL